MFEIHAGVHEVFYFVEGFSHEAINVGLPLQVVSATPNLRSNDLTVRIARFVHSAAVPEHYCMNSKSLKFVDDNISDTPPQKNTLPSLPSSLYEGAVVATDRQSR